MKRRDSPDVETPAPGTTSYKIKRKNPWIAVINLGVLMAGVTVGYFFRKTEEEFTRYGENLLGKILRGFNVGGDPDRERSRRRHDYDDDFDDGDPLGEGSYEDQSPRRRSM